MKVIEEIGAHELGTAPGLYKKRLRIQKTIQRGKDSQRKHRRGKKNVERTDKFHTNF